MIIVINGSLGVGKTTLSEALSESIDGSVMLDGDCLVAANPPFEDEIERLHSSIALLAAHHQRFGYRHFVINHIWTKKKDLEDLRQRLAMFDDNFRCFRLTLTLEENLRRIERRAASRELDERDFDLHTVKAERQALEQYDGAQLGEPFDVSGTLPDLVASMRERLGLM